MKFLLFTAIIGLMTHLCLFVWFDTNGKWMFSFSLGLFVGTIGLFVTTDIFGLPLVQQLMRRFKRPKREKMKFHHPKKVQEALSMRQALTMPLPAQGVLSRRSPPPTASD